MALVLRGNELITTEALSARQLAQLVSLAARRPLIINGVELRAQDLEQLAAEASRTGHPIWLDSMTSAPGNRSARSCSGQPDQTPLAPRRQPAMFREPPYPGVEIQDMRTHQEKTLAHAATRLDEIKTLTDPDEITGRFRAFLKIEDQRLRMAHRFGATGRQTAAARSFVIDQIVTRAFHASIWPGDGGEFLTRAMSSCAVIALGGYGRGEMMPGSDLDLLFLHTGRRAAQMKQLVERILRLLWDTGLMIGHSFRTVSESIAAARSDPHLQTALITTRLLVGNSALYDCLLSALERERRKRADDIINAIRRERDERLSKFGAAVCLQEPNVKEGAGGLRDLHTALWAAYARYGGRTLEILRARDVISDDELKAAERSYDFLLRVRYEAHLLTGRKTDRLALDLQPQLAERFGYTPETHLLASEKFMRDYYRRARALQVVSQAIFERAAEREPRPARWFTWGRAAQMAEPFSIRDGQLQLEGDAQTLQKNPQLIFDAFALGQAAGVPFGHSLRESIGQSLALVDRQFRASAETAESFLKLLRRRGRVGHALRLMHETGFLGRLMPEFGRISLLIQHDLYHHYTIDEHTLKAIEALDELSASHDKARAYLRAALDEVEDVALLYLSVLLHDIGKGRGSGHVARGMKIAARICARLRLSEEATRKVVLLVEHHLTMARVSQRRDLNEPHVAADFAAQVGSLDALDMLLLLTYADLSAVGPGVWTDWKGSLLWDLYERARTHITGAPLAGGPAEIARLKEQVAAALDGRLPPSEIERHFALLPDRYARTVTPEAAVEHLQMIEELKADVWSRRWRARGRAATELVICTQDRHGLFADITGTLAAQGIEILSADINTREDGIAIDIFTLRSAATHQAIEQHRWEAIERALRSAILGEADVAAMVERWRTRNAPRRRAAALAAGRRDLPQIVCDNEAALGATVLEVRAADEPGLAYKIASVLVALNLDIVWARVATEKSDALDVFYVTDANGLKLSEPLMRTLRTALTEKLSSTTGVALKPVQYKPKEITA
jgi:[protein-PII] uridylyltransferase